MTITTAPPTPARERDDAARTAAAGTAAAPAVRDVVQLLRPRQWVKNAFVLAPLLFSGRGTEPDALLLAFAAAAAFCALASGIYAWNDVLDRAADRAHPTKRNRPVASGRIPVPLAAALGAVLVSGAGLAAWAVSPTVGLVALAYVVLNVAYTLRFKNVVILDVFTIASFFVMRLIAGSAAIGVNPSVWLLLCGGLLALYLGFTKRRHELVLLGDASAEHRSVLAHYGPALLDQISAVLLGVTILCYIMYTLASETAAQVGSEALSYSTVFVLYGVFRYLYLVHQRAEGSPTETLFTDRALMIVVLLWLGYCGWVIYRPF